jgi:hypothetical protein
VIEGMVTNEGSREPFYLDARSTASNWRFINASPMMRFNSGPVETVEVGVHMASLQGIREFH